MSLSFCFSFSLFQEDCRYRLLSVYCPFVVLSINQNHPAPIKDMATLINSKGKELL